MKKNHRVFFAIPFDSATRRMYSRISKRITKRYPTVTTVTGNVEVGPSPTVSTIASFRDQNLELNRQFVAQIHDADVVIADLTHNNPNVHLELGIALMKNKNILRVTGRSVTELGFDIQNLEAFAYKHENDLAKKIIEYLATFFNIKKLPLSNRYGTLHWEASNTINLRRLPNSPVDVQEIGRDDYILRDGALQVEFEFGHVNSPDDWFGVFLRCGSTPFMGSHLVYVRQNGNIEIAVYPGPRIIKVLSTNTTISGRHRLKIQFENNMIEVLMGRAKIVSDGLSHQVAGRVLVAGWNAEVTVHAFSVICRDTIKWA